MFKLGEIDNYSDNQSELEEVCVPFEEDMVILFKPFFKVTNEMGTFYVANGEYNVRNESGEFDPDWSLTWVWEDLKHPENYLYFEQDPIYISLHNLFHDYKGNIKDWDVEIVEE